MGRIVEYVFLSESNCFQAAKSILPLLKKAEATIAGHLWVHTPIALKATAGLRLLDAAKAEVIIDEVSQSLTPSGARIKFQFFIL